MPRYHFCALEKVFYERKPYLNGKAAHVTRLYCISTEGACAGCVLQWLMVLLFVPCRQGQEPVCLQHHAAAFDGRRTAALWCWGVSAPRVLPGVIWLCACRPRSANDRLARLTRPTRAEPEPPQPSLPCWAGRARRRRGRTVPASWRPRRRCGTRSQATGVSASLTHAGAGFEEIPAAHCRRAREDARYRSRARLPPACEHTLSWLGRLVRRLPRL
jgi:hypothetical protein